MKIRIILAVVIALGLGFGVAMAEDFMVIKMHSGEHAVYNLSDVDSITFWASEDSGLVAFYPFNGNANDESGNGNNCTVSGATLTSDRFGNERSAYAIQNVGDILRSEVGREMSCSDITVSAWIRRTQTGNVNPRLVAVGPPNSHIQYYSMILDFNASGGNPRDSARIGFYCSDGNNDVTVAPYPSSEGAIGVGEAWRHLAIVYDGTHVEFYIDGELDTDFEATGNLASFENAILQIGRSDDGSDQFLGDIDDIRIYRRALSAVEIQMLYNYR